jgi:hypothetical protein
MVTALAFAAALGGVRPAAQTDIKVDYDEKFSFADLKTWAWHPDGPGKVRMAVSSRDDPARVAARVDPIIIPAVEREMSARKLTQTTSPESADFYLHYYVLVSVNQDAQFQGQFVPAVPEWGLPPFAPVTTSLSIYPVGTFVLDVVAREPRKIVWRGAAERRVDLERPDDERRQVLERAIRDLVRRFPPRR